jgi:hypothetical protein
MKHFQLFSVLLLTAFLLSSCSKKDDVATTAGIDLKNTVWAGEFQYASGSYTSLQPFSVVLKDDGTLTWSDLENTRAGGTWVTKKDTVVITFPNSTVISAVIAGDNWTSFKGGAEAGVLLSQVTRSVKAEVTTLVGTVWKGLLSGSTFTIEISEAGKLKYTLAGGSPITLDYTFEGAGMRFLIPGILSSRSYYTIFLNNTSLLKGIERYISAGIPGSVNYNTWSSNKQ